MCPKQQGQPELERSREVLLHAGSQRECEKLRRQLRQKEDSERYPLEARILQKELSMQSEIRFWRTRYAELCNKHGEKGVSYRSGAMDAVFMR